jgi:gas vesicle protein
MMEGKGRGVGYFVLGMGIGGTLGILFAPKSGRDTRKRLVRTMEDSKDYAQDKARELRERAEDFLERGKKIATLQKESLFGAIDAGREAYERVVSKAL